MAMVHNKGFTKVGRGTQCILGVYRESMDGIIEEALCLIL